MNMSLFASALFWTVFQPGHFLLLCLLVGFLVLLRGNLRTAKYIFGVSLLAFFMLALTPLSNWLIQPLETRFPAYSSLPSPAPIAGIIVLGGAEKATLSTAHQQATLNNRAERLVMAAKLAHQHPRALVIHTGGLAGRHIDGKISWRENDVARAFFNGMGLNPQRIFYDDDAYNTATNAIGVKRIMHRLPGRTGQWLLVTSAFHIPRAMGAFRAVGLDVVPYPVDYRSHGGRMTFSFPQLHESLEIADMAVHEWIGLLYYYLTGRSPELFPRP